MPLVLWPVSQSIGFSWLLGKLHARDRALPVTAWRREEDGPDRHDDGVHGLRDGVSPTLACIGSSASSVRLVGSAVPSEDKERQVGGGSSHCPNGLFLTHTDIHTLGAGSNVAKLPSSIACEKDKKSADHACLQRANSMAVIASSRQRIVVLIKRRSACGLASIVLRRWRRWSNMTAW